MAQDFPEDHTGRVTCNRSYRTALFSEQDLRSMEAVARMSHSTRQKFTACIGLAIDIDQFFSNVASPPQADLPAKASSYSHYILLTKTLPICFDLSNASSELAALMQVIFNQVVQIVGATVSLWQARFKYLSAVIVPTPDGLIVRFIIDVGP